ncbi:cupin domain-containing protein [Aliifodinibius sp. S!AR15-10]|uniref:cupin domain-containing protein n=1 Tax=Aliifodinibius sp. S!AR15-10 TaxID=2950437 RepID=UPI0028592EFB|nr:cupin domain-containing protein [Aliifodinibius sp. S!AR15-10]MDR8394546.1 cupin domain-containing protein [Aliifodinibius sp. S!AR15-10]
MSRLKMILLGIGLFIASYLSIGYFFHLIIFPEIRPAPHTYFEPGSQFGSEMLGDTLTVVSRENGDYRLKLQFAPGGEGPPLHIQTGWDETFKVESGNLGLLVNGEEKILEPGEDYTIRRGIPHKPYNPTDETVVCEVVMPAQFAVYLSQVYGYIDEDEKNMQPPAMIFQMALFNQYFDSYLGEGPPVFVQKALNFLIIPAARMIGYKSFYEKFRIDKQT